jgi:2,4-dienoyl-CoA reductase-like NADH-dependent reductase (Old Yellow Enzyme family)
MLYERMERGEFDLIAVGRAILQDPDWAAKVKDGRMDELEAFTAASLASLS